MVLLIKGDEETVRDEIKKRGGEVISFRPTTGQAWVGITGISQDDVVKWSSDCDDPYLDGDLLYYQ